MTSREDADEWSKRNDLQAEGIETRPYSSVHLHGARETPKHLLVKSLVARELQQRRGPKRWDTEVVVNSAGDRVDVLDYGPPGEPCSVYEIETDASSKVKLEKVEQYARGPIPETQVYFLDPTEAPDSIPELVEWVEQWVVA